MDLLKELEAKKEKLRLLKERRQLINEGNYHANNIVNDWDADSIGGKPHNIGENGKNHSKRTMTNAAVQTDNFSTESTLPALLPSMNDASEYTTETRTKVKTFDHGVQTDGNDSINNNTTSGNNNNSNNDSNNNGDSMYDIIKEGSFASNNSDIISSETKNKSSQIFEEDKMLKKNTSKLFELKPLIIDNGFSIEHGTNKISNNCTNSNANTYESFASHWYSRGENVKEGTDIDIQQEIGKTQNDKVLKSINNIYHLHTYEVKDNQHKDVEVVCKSVDFDINRHVTLVTFSTMHKFSNKPKIDMETVVPKSFIYVIDTFTDKIIDKLEFLGKIITKNRILRNDMEMHDIISMILLTERGKIILYELKKNVQQGDISWNRNILIKNYHLSCDYLNTIWETKFKLVVGDSRGYMSILNSLDLSYDITMFVKYEKDNNSDNNNNKFRNKTDLLLPSRIKVVPPSNSILYNTISEKVSSEIQLFIDKYLSKLVIFNELNITSIVGSPFNSECVFLGTEDGGIYKIFLDVSSENWVLKKDKNDGKNDNKIMIDTENHGFLPKISNEWLLSMETNLHEKILFHNSYVTSLSIDTQGLLLSSSIDWTIKLWDTKDNQILDSINLQKPVLSVEWIAIGKNKNKEMKCNLLNGKYLCYAMTWDTIYIIQWFIVKEVDPDKEKRERRYFKRGQPCKILSKIHIEQKYLSYNQFTSSKLVVDTIDGDKNLINTLLILGGNMPRIDYIQMVISPC